MMLPPQKLPPITMTTRQKLKLQLTLTELPLTNMELPQRHQLMMTMNMKKSPKHLLMLMELLLMNTALPQKLPLKNMLLKDVEDEEDSVAAATVTADPQPGPLRETTATAPV